MNYSEASLSLDGVRITGSGGYSETAQVFTYGGAVAAVELGAFP